MSAFTLKSETILWHTVGSRKNLEIRAGVFDPGVKYMFLIQVE